MMYKRKIQFISLMKKGSIMKQPDFFDKTKISAGKIKVAVIAAAVLIFASILVFTSYYMVDDKQQAVITTFGKVTSVTDAGIHFKIPFGIQKAHIVDVNISRKLEIGYRSDTADATVFDTVEKESKMITGDMNIVNVDFFVEYKVSDPVKFLFNSKDPETILKNLVQSQIRNVIGSAKADDVLTSSKAALQQEIKTLTIEELEAYDIGLIVTDVRIQDAELPTEEVNEAYKEVVNAYQGMEAEINLAEAYKNSEIPKMEAEVDKILKEAEVKKQERINEANMKVAMFSAMYEQYALNPEATVTRMYYEAISEILPGVKLYIDAGDGSTQKLLPLESFMNNSEKEAAE